MPSVFVSHSSKDTEFCMRLRQSLQAAGIGVWLDAADLKHGQQIESTIRKAIETHDFLVVVMSESSSQSHWAHFEVGLATSNRVSSGEPRVLPVAIDHSPLPIYVEATRFVDFREPGKYDAAVSSLVKSIAQSHESILLKRRYHFLRRAALALSVTIPSLLATWLYWRAEEERRDELSVTKGRIWDQVHTHRGVARELSRRLYEKYPDDPEVLRVRGWVLHFDHSSEEAIKLFDRGLKLVEDRDDETAQNLRLGKANALVDVGSRDDLSQARQLYSELVSRWRYENAYVNLGMLSMKEEQPARAAVEFEEARNVIKARHKAGQVNPALAYVYTGLAISRSWSGLPVDGEIVDLLKQAVCYQRAVLMFLALGEQSIGYFGYKELAPGWARLKDAEPVRQWLRTIDLATLKPGQPQCSGL
ncbi:MAG: toll/interleukin-1 receptor domain-containing protein [Rubrivivax sp.]|nr:toll/interleukin-1 receptor domain-containing protein [Rubrivivax sp.]